MKKQFVIALTIMAMLGTSACARKTHAKKIPVTPTPAVTPTPTPTPTPTSTPTAMPVAQESNEEVMYIGNKNSKKFHDPDCGTLPAEHNRVNLYSYEEAIADGFSPCKRCNPM